MTQRWPWLDPDDPRAPSMEIWEKLSASERAAVVDALPSEWQVMPPEGDRHRIPTWSALDSLDAFFKKLGRKVYLSSNLAVYYPDERPFAPDLFAVLDVETHERDKWVVAQEDKGIDFVLEVLLSGRRRKDLEQNVERYARLGIKEYFVFDRGRSRLHGYALPPGGKTYQAVVPQEGRWPSRVLGLDLGLEPGRVRFYYGTASVLDSQELLERANAVLERALKEQADLERRAEEESRRAEEESARARAAERKLAEVLAELERLKGR